MNDNDKLRRNPRVWAHSVDEGVWGLYNLDRAKVVYVDQLAFKLLELVDYFEMVGTLIEVCAASVDFDRDRVAKEVWQRLAKLVRFGGLEAVPPPVLGKVLLVDPPCPERMVGTRGPAKGLCYLSDALQRSQLGPAHILDLRSVSPQLSEDRAAWTAYFSKYASTVNPRVIGVTAVSATITNALFIGHLAKLMFPDAFLVLGGPHASYEWQRLLTEHHWLDAVVVGEGELPFPRLVERVCAAVNNSVDFSDIEGVAWRCSSGSPVVSGWCHGVKDLDLLGYPDDRVSLMNLGDYTIRYARVISSRGCPFRCSFCSTATFTGRYTRYRSIENVISEITYNWQHYQVTAFSFDDDIFTVNRKRVLSLCQALEQVDFAGKLEWGCNTRMDCINEEVIDAMHRAGCKWILFGIESGSEDVQDRFGKGRRSLHGFREKILYMRERGIEPQLNFILGLPGEDTKSVELILKLVEGLPGISCTFNFLNVFPGTPLASQAQELGIEFLSDLDNQRYSVTAPTLSTRTMTAHEQVEAYLKLQWSLHRDSILANDEEGLIGTVLC